MSGAPHRHYFRLKARFGPADLFAILRGATQAQPLKPQQPAFEFDWMKRRVEVSATSAAGAQQVLAEVQRRLERAGGPAGALLPGKPEELPEGRTRIPVGVLLQGADVFAEMMVQALREFGIAGVQPEFFGDGFSVPVTRLTNAMDYEALVAEFPLPDYLRLVDEGVHSAPPGEKAQKP